MITLQAVAAASSSWCPEDTLASCFLIAEGLGNTLNDNSVLILHRSQWQCLVRSYLEVLRAISHLVQHQVSTFPLRALHQAMQEGERCLQDSTTKLSSCTHSWLMEKAMKLSTEVVNVHLHNFLWSFAAILNQSSPHIDGVESDLIELTRSLSDIWTCEDAPADVLEACNFLSTVKVREDGETSYLANFLSLKLSYAQDLESSEPDSLPDYLWIDPGSLKRNPEVLGLGAYGKVHEGEWLDGRFAVKDFFYVENNVVFGREAAIQARLRHPNVIPLVCCTKNPSLRKCSLVMELMQQDLRVLMIEKVEAGIDPPFSLGVAVDLMLQIAQGVEYLHSLHIMHRDLKSANILVSYSRGRCDVTLDDVGSFVHLKVADFGMSKAKQASSKFTTRQVGATAWRAPEVFEINPEDEVEGGPNAKYTKKADVYSFALVCYEILTGKPPFEGIQVRKRVLAGERPLLPPYCPPALSSYIQRCWDAEPSRRPPFSQICRILRYFKACIHLQDYPGQSQSHNDGLLYPLSIDLCSRIDNMLLTIVQPIDTHICPKPVSIPLEMYCCGMVLKGRDEGENLSNGEFNEGRSYAGLKSTNSAQKFHSINDKQEQDDKNYKSSNRLKKCSRYLSRSLKRFFHVQRTQLAKSELQDALGLVRDYTYDELRLATADFSKVLGEGGSGKVYYGKLEDGREIAVKADIHPKLLQSGRILSASGTVGLVQELRIGCQLRHRNIVPLLGWCQNQGKLLLMYEFMPNGTLARQIFKEQNTLSWKRRYTIICQLASALKYLHQDYGYVQIVHRDVKAANVLLDSDWNARLGDWGLAVLLQNGDAPEHRLAGTFGYIAPESVTSNAVSPASDVYAFGITLLEIATGRRAYSKDAAGETQILRDWVWRLNQLGLLTNAVDSRLQGKFNEIELKRVFVLGLSCSSADPHMRPLIEMVLKILSEAAEPSSIVTTRTLGVLPNFGEWNSNALPQFSGSIESSISDIFRNDSMGIPPYMENNGLSTPKHEIGLGQNSRLRVFSLKELKLATRNFQIDLVIGKGGFGSVYKGWIDEIGPKGAKTARIEVAVKRLDERGLQGHKEWLAEVVFLGQLYHPNLVELIGYCCEKEHRLLVYVLMVNGCLEQHLFSKTKPLSWATRMHIALGAAKGLAFLHGAEKPVIVRDVKTSNILLDSDFTAKLSDFGLAKDGPTGDATHVSTRVLGTYGYAAPEYIATGHLTWRSDVYGFGVVLLELLTGRRSIDKNRGIKEQRLVEWASPDLGDKRKMLRIMDPRLGGDYSVTECQKVAALAFRCLNPKDKARPSMHDVVQTLESLQGPL